MCASNGVPAGNLAVEFKAARRNVQGGYAEFMTVPEAYAVAIPDNLSDIQAAPLMSAGAIGYRALRLTGIRNGEPLGLMGFSGPGDLVEDGDQAELLKLSYHQHLWMEREIKSVANLTHSDISEFLPLAAAIGLAPKVTTDQMEQANKALCN